MRRGIPSLLAKLPTRPAVHIGQQPEQERTGLPPRLHTTEPASDRCEPGVELGQPLLDDYAVPNGRRTIFDCLHKSSLIIRRPSPCPPTRRQGPEQPHSSPDIYITNPGCRI